MVIFELVEVVTPETTKVAAPKILPVWVKVTTLTSPTPALRVCEFIFKVPISTVPPISSSLITAPRSFKVLVVELVTPSKFAL